MDWMIGGLTGVLTGPIAYLVFKNIYKGTTDDALDRRRVSREGARSGRHEQLTADRPASSPAPPPSAAASTRTRPQPVFGIPQFFGIYSDYLSGVHVAGRPRRSSW